MVIISNIKKKSSSDDVGDDDDEDDNNEVVSTTSSLGFGIVHLRIGRFEFRFDWGGVSIVVGLACVILNSGLKSKSKSKFVASIPFA